MHEKYIKVNCINFHYFKKDSNKNVPMHNIFLCISFLVSSINKKEMKLGTKINFENKRKKKRKYCNNLNIKRKEKKITPTRFL